MAFYHLTTYNDMIKHVFKFKTGKWDKAQKNGIIPLKNGIVKLLQQNKYDKTTIYILRLILS
jgi:hypothetical protein